MNTLQAIYMLFSFDLIACVFRELIWLIVWYVVKLYIHALTTLLGTAVRSLIYATILSANHVAAVQCKKSIQVK